MRTLLTLSLAALTSAAGAADLAVTVTGVRSAQGDVRIAIYDRAEGFRKESRARQVISVPAAAGSVATTFPNLSAGRYAVIAYHDEDANGRLNLRFGRIRTEGYGLSSNPQVMGPPAFNDAAFDLPAKGEHITIPLSY